MVVETSGRYVSTRVRSEVEVGESDEKREREGSGRAVRSENEKGETSSKAAPRPRAGERTHAPCRSEMRVCRGAVVAREGESDASQEPADFEAKAADEESGERGTS